MSGPSGPSIKRTECLEQATEGFSQFLGYLSNPLDQRVEQFVQGIYRESARKKKKLAENSTFAVLGESH